ncbi:ankyrin repeat-containing domain protein [Parasitella parasitica]|nr:ankyrin repeat-containing domain protein [Parasitella parasitica]
MSRASSFLSFKSKQKLTMEDLSRDMNQKANVAASTATTSTTNSTTSTCTVMPTPIVFDEKLNSKQRLEILISQVDDEPLHNLMQTEFQHMLIDQQRLVTMLEQKSELAQAENEELKLIIGDSQKRYEKAVREMQFFKKKFDRLVESTRTAEPFHQLQNYLTTSPPQQPPTVVQPTVSTEVASSIYSFNSNNSGSEKLNWPTSPTLYSEPISNDGGRNNSNTAPSLYSNFSSSTESTVFSHFQQQQQQKILEETTKKSPTAYQFSRNPSLVSSYSIPSTAPSIVSSSGASTTSTAAAPMTPVRSSVSMPAAYTENSMILQKKTDPLCFGGSETFWTTLSTGRRSDGTVEKIVKNFLQRGGSPNTANQSFTVPDHAVKYGYGMIHALIVTKSSSALKLLLEHGANPNAVSISQVDEDKSSPCYLAAQVGWFNALYRIVESGGDLISARGGGSKQRTALHTAAENGYMHIAEYIVHMTQGTLNLEKDSSGALPLHYACTSGNTDLVSFLIKVCHNPIDDHDNKSESPIHWAARSGKLEVVTLLTETFGCDVNAYVSKKVPTPFDIAKSSGHKRVAEYLKSKGGITAKKMDKRKEDDDTPPHLKSALSKNGFFLSGF